MRPPAGLLQAEHVGHRVGPDPGPPDQRPGRDHGAVLEQDLVRGGALQGLAEPHLHPPLLEDLEGVPARAGMERRQQVVGGLQQDDLGLVDVQVGEVVHQHVLEQLLEGAGHLDPGGAAADHHHGQGALVDHAGVVLGQLELAQQVGPEPQGVGHALERVAVLLDPRDPEGGRGRARGHDQVVVAEAAALLGQHLPGLEVHPRHGGHPHRGAPVAAHDAAHRVGDVGRLDQPGGQLVQQRLEQVVVVLLEQGDPHRRLELGQGLDRRQPGEPSPDDDNARRPVAVPRPRHPALLT